MTTNVARCTTHEVEPKIATPKKNTKQRESYSHQQISCKFKEETSKVLQLGAKLCVALKSRRFGKQIRNIWKVMKCGARKKKLR
jgi:hypothetical protein